METIFGKGSESHKKTDSDQSVIKVTRPTLSRGKTN